jgi:hypothetical protein
LKAAAVEWRAAVKAAVRAAVRAAVKIEGRAVVRSAKTGWRGQRQG